MTISEGGGGLGSLARGTLATVLIAACSACWVLRCRECVAHYIRDSSPSRVKMLKEYPPVIQALLGTLLTWALTAAGAALVIVIQGKQVSIRVFFYEKID